MYEVILSPEAKELFAAADAPLARKLARYFNQLEREPHNHGNIRRLTGGLRGLYRYRVGDWRVIYRIVERENEVHVLTIAHRREVYD